MKPDFIPVARPVVGDEELASVKRVISSGVIAQGPEVAAFEREFADVVGDRHCVAVNSGTSALLLALLSLGLRRGDEVIVPSFTFAATANAVALTGATPVFVDIHPTTYCMDPNAAEAAVSPRTRAVIPVHLYGHPADLSRLSSLAQRHGLWMIEDAAQAHGAAWRDVPVGAWGALSAFSFYPTKNMTSGEGGMAVTACDHLARQVRLLRNQGMERRYANEIVGYNARMTDIHAAIGRVQLARLDSWNRARRRNAQFLDENLDGVATPRVAEGAIHVYHQYTVRVPEDRDGFAASLEREFGVGTGVYYPTPTHRLASFGRVVDLPETERAAAEVLSLPVHPSLTTGDLERIVLAVNSLVEAGG